ncbi:hypothetical protein CO155_02795 [Candidatus Pacearchaeota archaeon CG_4_9_14_3_um_filter_35_19]|nr:MAG: hypothetical protein CO155_02795 [Candidatus Pacearchaeota archaeon CG_4_9_14_3_um_filter_35_19]
MRIELLQHLFLGKPVADSQIQFHARILQPGSVVTISVTMAKHPTIVTKIATLVGMGYVMLIMVRTRIHVLVIVVNKGSLLVQTRD